ncbi:transporter, cation-chloride cotransporter (CCC) family [Mariniphaga anaerophila]|uniref:Transporter, cation-chloride cotransporter (CCC) family n=1 Tax=Mariniphaga anaerophila TaxID=1484053 RepID=A0A1M5F5Z5_9BACT|nr:amino acid permease [Mariniphaga anaerophila]SHF86929.1 transporter, cation-chloride cotransporter (CCC) family [Mariniphaga anaerophila]
MTIETKKFGTAPVFFTAISTILGAILFLRFGYAVGTLGFWGVILIILLGHLVTIPTALAISEIATNKRVEGGGEYFIISRSFGLNIGATIGIALFFSQAISVAFYVIAFTEAFEFFFKYISDTLGFVLPRQAISLPVMAGLAILIIKKGANLGVKALYFVVAVLLVSLVMFFLGKTGQAEASTFNLANAQFRNKQDFFVVFAIIFPAFTGMTAGVGLSGDLKRPSVSIPMGTTLATFSGMIIYFFVVYKLAQSASVQDLLQEQLIMSRIALGGAIVIPLGLAASTISSALGSVMVAPRTLQALALDKAFPSKKVNSWLAKGRIGDNEPVNASLITSIIAFIFVALGDVNAVASIISMFFMVTYGSLCLISVLNHFGSSPSYRPSFKSRWYISLTGFAVAVWVMFKISTLYAVLAFMLITVIYLYVDHYHKTRKGFASIFANALFQLNRNLQVLIQKKQSKKAQKEWRPSAICISKDSFKRDKAFRLLNWISYKYGFGTYLHHIVGYYSKSTAEQARLEHKKLIDHVNNIENHVYIDTLISPSNTSAIAQAIQIPGIAGMENNMVIFEYDKDNPTNLEEIIDNFALVNSGDFDICILSSGSREIQYKKGIHIWINSLDTENANLMIFLGFIISGHPDWRKGHIQIFNICRPEEVQSTKKAMEELVISGRLPISGKNIKLLTQQPEVSTKAIINNHSSNAGLTLIGIREERIKKEKEKVFDGYDELGTILFVHSKDQKTIE